MEYSVGDIVRCMWGLKPVEYEAKIIRANAATKEYFVHYQGWNKRHDEWISEKSILGAMKKQQATPVHCDTPKIRHSRREKKLKKPIDWSPTSHASAHTVEKPTPEKISNKVPYKHRVPISSKRKHSPVPKATKSKTVSPVLTTTDELTEESVTSDEEEGGDTLPRSYIDVLAKAKKRAERKSQQKSSPKTASIKPNKILSKMVDHGDADSGDLDITQPGCKDFFAICKFHFHEPEKSSATAPPTDASSESVECHGFSSIGGDHNYSSLRFHYNETPPPNVAENGSGSGHVSSSTQRIRILPVRRPLDIEYFLPYSPSMSKLAKPLPNILTRPQHNGRPVKTSKLPKNPRRRVEQPPNLGSPFTYCDEYHYSMAIKNECGLNESCGEQAIAASNLFNINNSDGVTISSSCSESEDSLSDQRQITAQDLMGSFTVSTESA